MQRCKTSRLDVNPQADSYGSISTSIISTTVFSTQWTRICEFLHKHYYKPDDQGLLITLCAYRAHFWTADPPVWLAIIGPPGSGKTEIACGALESLPKVQSESTLTVNSFLSGTGDKMGILPNLKGGNGVIVFPDFTTTILAIEPIKRIEISGQLRRIADGSYEKSVGNQEKQLRWSGKVTCIAAGTQDIESFFDENRDKGDRWIYLRWRVFNESVEDRLEYAKRATESMGHSSAIKTEYQRLIYGLFKSAGVKNEVEIDPTVLLRSNALAVLLETLRTGVKREWRGRAGLVVMAKGNTQMATRTPKNFVAIARASCALRGGTEIDDQDLQLSYRLALDSIPNNRRKVLDILLQFRKETLTKSELAMAAGLTRTAFDIVLEDLRILEVVTLIPGEDSSGLESMLLETEPLDPNNPYITRKPKAHDRISLTPQVINLLARSGM